MNAPCRDCRGETLSDEWGEPTEYYMVEDEVWTQAGMAPNGGYLCIGCLERRLRRRLLPADFIDAPVNGLGRTTARYSWSYRTKRLRDRLTGRGSEPAPDPPGQERLF